MALSFAGLGAGNYLLGGMNSNINDYITYVDAEEDMLVSHSSSTILDQNGKIATEDFYGN